MVMKTGHNTDQTEGKIAFALLLLLLLCSNQAHFHGDTTDTKTCASIPFFAHENQAVSIRVRIMFTQLRLGVCLHGVTT